jgi:hypothetical protein
MALMDSFTCFHGSSRRVTSRAWASLALSSTGQATRAESSDSASHGSRKLITSYDQTAAAAARIRFDVYYGMADNRIGVARLDVPDFLPPGGTAEPPQARCAAPDIENSKR